MYTHKHQVNNLTKNQTTFSLSLCQQNQGDQKILPPTTFFLSSWLFPLFSNVVKLYCQKCTQPKPSQFYIHHTHTNHHIIINHHQYIYMCLYIYMYMFVLTAMPLMNALFKGWPGNIGHKTSSTKHGSHDRIIKLAPIVVHPTSRNAA